VANTSHAALVIVVFEPTVYIQARTLYIMQIFEPLNYIHMMVKWEIFTCAIMNSTFILNETNKKNCKLYLILIKY